MAAGFQRQRKLSEDDVRAIIAKTRSGATQASLAREYGVSIGAINYRLSKVLERPSDHQHCPTCTCMMRGI